jgi:hypothetical protein
MGSPRPGPNRRWTLDFVSTPTGLVSTAAMPRERGTGSGVPRVGGNSRVASRNPFAIVRASRGRNPPEYPRRCSRRDPLAYNLEWSPAVGRVQQGSGNLYFPAPRVATPPLAPTDSARSRWECRVISGSLSRLASSLFRYGSRARLAPVGSVHAKGLIERQDGRTAINLRHASQYGRPLMGVQSPRARRATRKRARGRPRSIPARATASRRIATFLLLPPDHGGPRA